MLKTVELPGTELRVFHANASHRDSTTLLFVHGFPLDHSMWQFQLQHFQGRCHLIAPDLRGFGGSTEVKSGPLTMEQHADDLANLLDALCVTEPVVLCGLSMGGYVAWQFERRHSDRLKALVLCDTKSAADASTMQQARRTLAERVLKEGTQDVSKEMLAKLFSPRTIQQAPGFLQQTLDVMASTSRETVAAALRGMADRPDATSWLSDIRVPCCVVCGEHDRISPPDEMREISARLANASFFEVQEAGHMAPLEQAAEVNSAIDQFLDGLG